MQAVIMIDNNMRAIINQTDNIGIISIVLTIRVIINAINIATLIVWP